LPQNLLSSALGKIGPSCPAGYVNLELMIEPMRAAPGSGSKQN